MTNLTGTEKQIAWAAEIRRVALETMEETFAKGLAKSPNDPMAATVRQTIDKAAAIKSAAWWIENINGIERNPRMMFAKMSAA